MSAKKKDSFTQGRRGTNFWTGFTARTNFEVSVKDEFQFAEWSGLRFAGTRVVPGSLMGHSVNRTRFVFERTHLSSSHGESKRTYFWLRSIGLFGWKRE